MTDLEAREIGRLAGLMEAMSKSLDAKTTVNNALRSGKRVGRSFSFLGATSGHGSMAAALDLSPLYDI